MSLLNKTIISFFPNRKQCAFIGEQWFIENPDIQLDVLKICWAGMSHLIKTSTDKKKFVEDIQDIILYEIPEKFTGHSFLKMIVKDIIDGDFLLFQYWFVKSSNLQVDVTVAAMNNISFLIDVHSSDIYNDLYQILKVHYESFSEEEIYEDDQEDFQDDQEDVQDDQEDFQDDQEDFQEDEQVEEQDEQDDFWEDDEDYEEDYEYTYPYPYEDDDDDGWEPGQKYYNFETPDAHEDDEDYWNERMYKIHLKRIQAEKAIEEVKKEEAELKAEMEVFQKSLYVEPVAKKLKTNVVNDDDYVDYEDLLDYTGPDEVFEEEPPTKKAKTTTDEVADILDEEYYGLSDNSVDNLPPMTEEEINELLFGDF